MEPSLACRPGTMDETVLHRCFYVSHVLHFVHLEVVNHLLLYCIIVSVKVAEWPSFVEYLLIQFTICSLSIIYLFLRFSHFGFGTGFWFWLCQLRTCQCLPFTFPQGLQIE